VLAESALGWWEDSRFVSIPCRLIDVSQAGCLVEAAPLPSRTERLSVLVRIQGASPEDWVEGVVVATKKSFFRKCQIRIGFLAPLPYESFKTLVYGPSPSSEAADSERLEHEKDHFWR
jgi:hypothetical protein